MKNTKTVLAVEVKGHNKGGKNMTNKTRSSKVITEKAVRARIKAFLDAEKNPISITKGNTKLGTGIYSFSTLPGSKDHLITKNDGEVLCEIEGTCGDNCEACFGGCYARVITIAYTNARGAYARNTILLRDGLAFYYINEFINKKQQSRSPIKEFRINVSGEITTYNEIVQWNEIAKMHPEIRFGAYTKATKELIKFVKEYGQTSDNFTINLSLWNHNIDNDIRVLKGLGFKGNIFEYDGSLSAGSRDEFSKEDKERLASIPHCPGIDQHGRHTKDKDGNPITCDKCNICYLKKCVHIACYAH